jgi:hypothetical protein
MPLEKDLILGLLRFDDVPSYNITVNLSKCPIYQDRLDKSNDKLWNICVYYLIAINAILLLLFCKDLLHTYVKFGENSLPSPKYNSSSSLTSFGSGNNLSEQKKNDDRGIEMVSFVKRGTEEPRETWFAIYYWKQSVFVMEMCKMVQFIVLVAVFEYLFFKLVVNKYKILDQKTLLCNLANEMLK